MSDVLDRIREAGSRARRPGAFVPDRALEAAQSFLRLEASGGIVLLFAAALALIWVNSPMDRSYFDLWNTRITVEVGSFNIDEDLRHLVNDGLMAIFFFVVALEIKRELVRGELADSRRALLPVTAALGGMLVPALVYVAFNAGRPGADGWGIPMATDIAFAVGVLSLVGNRVPFGVKIFLLALAIVDDMGAILVIALFYTESVAPGSLAIAAFLLAVIVLLSNAGVRSFFTFLVLGGLLWVAMLKSGVHATIAGVALGFVTPSRPLYDPSKFGETISNLLGYFRMAQEREDKGDQEELLREIEDVTQGSEAPLERFERALHPWVSYFVMPVFALANAGVVLSSDSIAEAASSAITHGIVVGLVVGKTVGIFAFAWLAVRLGLCTLPNGTKWRHIAGVAMLGGIGFTVSLFITALAFPEDGLIADAKIGILFASVVAGFAGFASLTLLSGSSGEVRQDA